MLNLMFQILRWRVEVSYPAVGDFDRPPSMQKSCHLAQPTFLPYWKLAHFWMVRVIPVLSKCQ